MSLSRFAFPCPIVFGAGARLQVAGHLTDVGVRRPLIVTDRALAALPLLDQFKATLKGLGGQHDLTRLWPLRVPARA